MILGRTGPSLFRLGEREDLTRVRRETDRSAVNRGGRRHLTDRHEWSDRAVARDAIDSAAFTLFLFTAVVVQPDIVAIAGNRK